MAPRAPFRQPAPSSLLSLLSLVAALVGLGGLGACLQDAVASSPPRADDAPIVSGVASPEPTARLAIVDRAGSLHVLDGSGKVLASAAGRATDVVAASGSIATFEPATGDGPGAVRVFTLTGSTLVEGPTRSLTTETGGLVTIGPGSDTVLAWEEAERASLLTVGSFDSGGVSVGSPSSLRVARFPDGSSSIEALIIASGSPRIDRFRIDPGGGLSPSDDFPVPVAPDVEARLASASPLSGRLIVSLEQGNVRLRDEAGGEETGPVVAAKATLEDAAAHDGRLALLLGSPPQLLVRDREDVYTAHDLPGTVPADPRPSHRLAFTADAVFVVSQAGLSRLAWPEMAKTAIGPVEPVLTGAVAVVALE